MLTTVVAENINFASCSAFLDYRSAGGQEECNGKTSKQRTEKRSE